MTTIVRAIIIALAMLTAMVLVFFGIRELRTGLGRHGLFVTTLLAALSIAGCNGHKDVRSAADQPVTGAEPAGQDVAMDAPATSGAMAELAVTKQWADFKALWKKLDQVNPTVQGDESSYLGEYQGALTYEEAQALHEELGRVIGALRKPGMNKLIGDIEIDLLESICTKRIDYLQYGLQSMMTRMVQPPMMIDKEHSIRELERHIDVLVELKASGKISDDEFDAAFAIVVDDIQKFAILDALTGAMGYYQPLYPILEERTESLITAFENDYDAFHKKSGDKDKELAALYEKAKTAIDELKLVLPYIAELVSDLES
jgi:hypothetical protein